MAILRGGRRIGNTDIRIGIPRDRSLDNVQNDPRLRRVQGNPESTIGRFQGKMAEGEGFARPSRFMVDFILPRGLDEQASNEAGQDKNTFKEEYNIEELDIYFDDKNNIPREARAAGLPHSIFINQNGNEIAKLIGPAEWDSDYFVNFIRETLN